MLISAAIGQEIPVQRPGNITYDSQGRPIRKNTGNDSLTHRNPLEDSITIFFRYFDSTRIRHLDSSINDFNKRFPLPFYYVDLGNLGSAAHSLLFQPFMRPGWDAGFHAYDLYRFSIEGTRFFQTTRPYSELGYMLGSKAEQMIQLLHTQNRGSNFNFTFEYRFINAPGALRNANTMHSNMRINTFYQTNNKRYGLYAIYLNNKRRANENGGIRDDKKLDSLSLNDMAELDTRLGNNNLNNLFTRNMFSSNVGTGISYKENTFYIRHYYDFGQKDSMVTDTMVYKLFYPRLRFQHSLQYTSYEYEFHDYYTDSFAYATYFNLPLPSDSIQYKDEWKEFTNEFSIITFPDKKNVAQFLRLSGAFQMLKGSFDSAGSHNYNSLYASAEYRNRTRNGKWDAEAAGRLYFTGEYAGNYSIYISLKRLLSKNIGSFEIGFQNVNRTPSFITEPISSFPSIRTSSFNNENILRFFASIELPKQRMHIFGNYYMLTNYTYFDSFLTAKQESSLFPLIQIGLEKQFRLSKLFNWYTEIYVQQAAGNPPVNVPSLLTRNRIALEANFFKNLFLSTGLEIRYYTSYKPDNYSPFTGQFFVQNSFSTSNRPDISFYFNLRIKSFKGFLRIENLNSLDNSNNGWGFTKHNFSAPHYPTAALTIRMGIWWAFVN